MQDIRITDDFLNEPLHNEVLEYCVNAAYSLGEGDRGDVPPVGMTHDIPKEHHIWNLFKDNTMKLLPVENNEWEIIRMYINCFHPSDVPYWHGDSDKDNWTFLYYPNNKWELDDGGETHFLIDDGCYALPPLPNRMVMFDARIKHRATSFRYKHRFSVAVKVARL